MVALARPRRAKPPRRYDRIGLPLVADGDAMAVSLDFIDPNDPCHRTAIATGACRDRAPMACVRVVYTPRRRLHAALAFVALAMIPHVGLEWRQAWKLAWDAWTLSGHLPWHCLRTPRVELPKTEAREA
ncbi:MAG: hypothetical protein AAF805_03080 [Planctomycetota bacterium]